MDSNEHQAPDGARAPESTASHDETQADRNKDIPPDAGRRAGFDPATGAVHGAGVGAGGGAEGEDYDSDAASGDGPSGNPSEVSMSPQKAHDKHQGTSG